MAENGLPKSIVQRVAKTACQGTNVKLTPAGLAALLAAGKEFISLLSNEALQACEERKRSQITEDDVIHALEILDFQDYISGVKEVVGEHLEITAERSKLAKRTRDKFKNSGMTMEELEAKQKEALAQSRAAMLAAATGSQDFSTLGQFLQDIDGDVRLPEGLDPVTQALIRAHLERQQRQVLHQHEDAPQLYPHGHVELAPFHPSQEEKYDLDGANNGGTLSGHQADQEETKVTASESARDKAKRLVLAARAAKRPSTLTSELPTVITESNPRSTADDSMPPITRVRLE